MTDWEHDNAKFEEQFERVVRALRADEDVMEKPREAMLLELLMIANYKHVQILRQGVKEWNVWRAKHREIPPDLLQTDFRNACLEGVDLVGGLLVRAVLVGTNFRGADLRGVDLRDARLGTPNLAGVNLTGARLEGTDLRGADLRDADLSRANLARTVMTGANLSCTNLARAVMAGSQIGNLDLSEGRGLEDIVHRAPSTIGTDTLYHSQSKIPEIFLRGCGLSDWEIDAVKLYNPDLTDADRTDIAYEILRIQGESPIQISYSHADTTFVETIEKLFREKHVRYWRDVHDLTAGRLETQIEHAIRHNPTVLLVLSERSVKSDWVEWEASRARKLEKELKRDVLCPIALDNAWKACDWPAPLRRQIQDYHILDLSQWQDPEAMERQFARLVEGLGIFYPGPEVGRLMANPEHLKILKQGVVVWNRWRKENLEIRPDLAIARLEHADLERAGLADADLANARLPNARLVGARLRGAFLPVADLTSANLKHSSLAAAILTSARLRRAELQHAQLINASFSDVDLSGAKLTKADMLRTTIAGTNLSETLGLEAVVHRGPSAIGTSTLERTALGLSNNDSRRGEIETFYRGAGVEEHIIEYFRSWKKPAIQFYSSFISYSHTDKSFARRLRDQLQASGIRCWLEEHELKPGNRILDVVNDAIWLHDKILLCCSETSLSSWWVKDEIEKALERERRERRDIIIPLNLDGYLFEGWESGQTSTIRSRLAADFTGWEHDNAKFDKQFERVV